jgi:PKD domain
MKIDVSSYTVTDSFFGAPYIDEDEERDDPVPHRQVHGGFEGTDTRFRFYFPPAAQWGGRMFNPLNGAHGGDENFFGTELAVAMGHGIPLAIRLGAYLIESNQGHIGDDVDPKGGDDPTIYGHRASAEVARFSKHVATQVYGSPPHHSYISGGSGGARRSPLCLENAPGVWDGCVPYMGGGEIAEPGNTKRIKGAQTMSFATMFNVQRILGPRLRDVVDAMAAGGSGDPFTGLTTHQREELATLYRLGYPRGDEFNIGEPMGQMWLWTSMASDLVSQDPDYFEAFWTKPGYVGHDQPGLVLPDVVDTTATVSRVLTSADILEDPEYAGAEHQALRSTVAMMAAAGGGALPVAIVVPGLGNGYPLGSRVRVLSGSAAGRTLYCARVDGDVLYCDGHGEANLERFRGVLAGDEVHVDNRDFLAFCYFARHHLMDDLQFDSLRVDGNAVYPQHPVPLQSALMGVAYSGQFDGKLIWIHHTHDASLWPPQGVIYEEAVGAAQGPEGARARFRLRWTENAEHGAPERLATSPERATTTWLIDPRPAIEQTLMDLIDWVEHGIEPVGTNYEYAEGRVTLPASAVERSGIQPVVRVSANGRVRADVTVGEPVELVVHAQVPPGAGTVVSVEWDFDGRGAFPFRHDEVDGSAAEVTLRTTHAYERPGTYFVTARVKSHRDGDVEATSRCIPNVAQARVVVGTAT